MGSLPLLLLAQTNMKLVALLGFIPLITGSPYFYLPYRSYGYGLGYGYHYPTTYHRPGYRYYGYRPSLNTVSTNFRNTDLIQQTRPLANSVKSTLRSLARDPDSAVIIQK